MLLEEHNVLLLARASMAVDDAARANRDAFGKQVLQPLMGRGFLG